MATTQTPPSTPVSPKVIYGGFVSGLVTLLLTTVSAITPDTFKFLGPWALPVYGLVILAAYALTAYRVPDPLRIPATPGTDPGQTAPPAGNVIVNAPATAADPLTVSGRPAASGNPSAADAALLAKIDAAIAGPVVTAPAAPQEPAPLQPAPADDGGAPAAGGPVVTAPEVPATP